MMKTIILILLLTGCAKQPTSQWYLTDEALIQMDEGSEPTRGVRINPELTAPYNYTPIYIEDYNNIYIQQDEYGFYSKLGVSRNFPIKFLPDNTIQRLISGEVFPPSNVWTSSLLRFEGSNDHVYSTANMGAIPGELITITPPTIGNCTVSTSSAIKIVGGYNTAGKGGASMWRDIDTTQTMRWLIAKTIFDSIYHK